MTTAAAEASPGEEAMSEGVLFEALFRRALQAPPALQEVLRQAGYDVERPAAAYPARVFRACVDGAAQQLFPHLPREHAYWQLGRALLRGFCETEEGRALAEGLPLLGPARLLRRYPEGLPLGHRCTRVQVHQLGPREFRLEVSVQQAWAPELDAGALEEALGRTHTEPVVSVVSHRPEGYVLHAAW